MPTHTLPINQTLPVGQTIFGPLTVGNNTSAKIVTDRTVAGALNTLTSDSTVAVLIQTSPDGSTWKDLCGATWVGGVYINPIHGQLDSDSVGTGDIDAAVTRVRVLATVTGPSSVVIAGTLTVT
jgi:hypothetical protein